jgi:hypothetical protein
MMGWTKAVSSKSVHMAPLDRGCVQYLFDETCQFKPTPEFGQRGISVMPIITE